MVQPYQDGKGALRARKRIPHAVQDEYAALYGPRLEAKFFEPATTAPREQRRKFNEWLADVEGRIAAILATRSGEGQSLTPRQARTLAGDWYLWWTARHATGARSSKEQAEEWLHQAQSAIRECVSEAEAVRFETDELWERPQVRENVRPVLADIGETAQFLASKGVALTNKARDLFLDNLYADLAAALHRLIRLSEGDYSPDKYPARFPKSQEGTDSGVAPVALFEMWVAAKQPAAGTIENWKYVFAFMRDHFADRSAGSITEEEAREWIRSLITATRSARSVANTHLKASKTVFTWALREKLVPSNPFADVPITVPRRKRQRSEKSFTEREIQTILTASLAIDDKTTPDNAAKRWVPWICAYTGARVGEITQLRGSDVVERDGIHALEIRPDAGTVKTGHARTVPLHPHLIEQGFLKFVARKGSGPLFYNKPSKVVPARRKSRYAQARQRLAAWVRKIGVKDAELLPNHAWRHTFKQIAARHGITETVSDYITGHAPATVGRAYSAASLGDMATALKKKFPRYEIGKAKKTQRDMAAGKKRLR